MKQINQSFPITAWTWVPPAVALILIAIISLANLNQTVFLTLNHAGQIFGNLWWANVTILGDGAVTLALILLVIRRSPRSFWGAVFGAVIVSLLIHGMKYAIVHQRPPAVLLMDQFFLIGQKLVADSFPSGHTAAIFTLAGVCIMSLKGRLWLQFSVFMLACLVGLSRIMVGVHWPLDVLAGMIAGWISAYAGLWISTRLGLKTKSAMGYVAGSILMLIAAALLISSHAGYPEALPFQRLLGIICLFFGGVEIYRMTARSKNES